jgi:hypothetical protein
MSTGLRPSLLIVGLLLGAEIGTPPAVPAQDAGRYAGDWVCQTFTPGYNIRPPSADASQPLTNHMTTPSTVAVLKLRLRADGSYQAADGAGRYALDLSAKTITWLDGPYRQALTKTQVGRRDNGEPTLAFVRDKRYYGCFKPR